MKHFSQYINENKFVIPPNEIDKLLYKTIEIIKYELKRDVEIGKYNQQVANRNATIAEQEAGQINKQADFDIARFDQRFRQAVGTVEVQLAKSGVVMDSGTGARITMANAIEAEMEKNVMQYNANIGTARKMEEANFSRISGQMAKQQARLAQIQTLSKTGSSLLNMGAFDGLGKTPSPYKTSRIRGPYGRLVGGV